MFVLVPGPGPAASYICMFSVLGPELHAGKVPVQQHVQAQISQKVSLNRAAYAIVSYASMHLPLALLCFSSYIQVVFVCCLGGLLECLMHRGRLELPEQWDSTSPCNANLVVYAACSMHSAAA